MSAAETLPADDLGLEELVHVDRLSPAPDNPRGDDLGDLDELADTIRSAGIIHPLIVTKRAGRFVIVDGHRRYAAAKVAGVEQVPVIIRNYTEEQRQQAMLVTALQRRDLSPLAEARGFAALAALGHSQRDIATKVGRTQPHVSKRIRLLDLPDEVQEAVESRAWPIEDALHLAKLSGSPAAVRKLFKIASEPGFYGSVERLVEDAIQAARDKRKKREVKAELEKMQVRIVELDTRVTGNYLMLPPGQRPVGEQWVRGLKLDVEKHEQEPCAATALLSDGRTAPICTDASRHEAADVHRPSPGGTQRQVSGTSDGPSPERLHREALDAAKADRRAAAKAAVRPPKKATAELAWAALEVALEVAVDQLWGQVFDLAGDWLGIEIPKNGDDAAAAAIVAHARTSHEHMVSTVMAVYAALAEARLSSGGYRRDAWEPIELDYLDWLGETVGYELSPAEQVEVDKAKATR